MLLLSLLLLLQSARGCIPASAKPLLAKRIRELEATKKHLEQRVSAMATEASCIESEVKRLLREVEDRFCDDLNGSSSLGSAYHSLLKSISRPLQVGEDTAPVHCGANNEDDGMTAVSKAPRLLPT